MARNSGFLAALKRRPVVSFLMASVLAVLLLLVLARYWITTSGGRDFVISQIEGREVAGYGRLSVRGMEGDPLSDFSLRSLEVRDAQGTWLAAKDIRVSWSALAVLSGTIDLDGLAVKEARILRQPKRKDVPESRRAPWNLRLNQARIDRLTLAEGVAGPETALAVSGRLANARSGVIDTQLLVEPLDGAGDRIEARIRRDRQSAFDLKLDSVAPAGGVFAHLLQLPAGASAVITATAAGNLDDGRGEARMTIDGKDEVFVSAKIENRILDAGVRFNAEALPLSASLKQFVGPAAEADVTVRFEKDVRRFEIDSRLANGTVLLKGEAHPRRLELSAPTQVRAKLTSLAPYWNGASAVNLDGRLQDQPAGLSYEGALALAVRPESSLPFSTASGPVTFSVQKDRIPFSGDVVVAGAFARNQTLSGVLGDAVRVSGNGVFERASRRALFEALEISHQTGTLQLIGETGFADGTVNLSGKITQELSALPGGFNGDASGLAEANGKWRDFELGLNLSASKLSTDVDWANTLVAGPGTARGIIRVRPSSGDIRRVAFQTAGVNGQVSGQLWGAGSPALNVSGQQLTALTIAGDPINLGTFEADYARRSGGLLLSLTSKEGVASIRGRTVTNLTARASFDLSPGRISGPVTATGRSNGQPASLAFKLERSNGSSRFSGVSARLGQLNLSGTAQLNDTTGVESDFVVLARDFEAAGITFGTMQVKGRAIGKTDAPLDFSGDLSAESLSFASRKLMDSATVKIVTTPAGYEVSGRLLDARKRADSDIRFSGLVSKGANPSGRLSLSGKFLSQAIETDEDARWTLGPAPGLEASLKLLGGRLRVDLSPDGTARDDSVTAESLSVAPVLAALGLPELDAAISGKAVGRFYGENPQGTFDVSAVSAVSGVNTAINLRTTGRVDRSAFAFTGTSDFGAGLNASFAARIPARTSPQGLVQPDRKGAIDAVFDAGGDLGALQLIALAYGHDIDGTFTSRTRLAGTLDKPIVRLDANLSDGLYEYGATGLSLKNVSVNAHYDNRVLTVDGTADGKQGGNLQLAGRLAEDAAGVDLKLSRLLVYDRFGDLARLSGNAHLTEEASYRLLSGALSIDEAKFDLENLSTNTIRTLNVRWAGEDAPPQRNSILEKPIRFDLDLAATKGLFVRGRGLDSEWGAKLDVTGDPANVLLDGRATLVRGSLELARRPFVFDSGQINFNGPVSAAELALSAKRELNGLSVRVNLGGSPAKPSIDLASTPSLPQDEILARMLFGRSSVDLTALEAAELATSIARLTGRSTGLDPLGAIQDGLGVDRLRFGIDADGRPELGVGQYIAPDVYAEVTTQGATGNALEVEWQPEPGIAVTSETSSTGESRIALRWKNDY